MNARRRGETLAWSVARTPFDRESAATRSTGNSSPNPPRRFRTKRNLPQTLYRFLIDRLCKQSRKEGN